MSADDEPRPPAFDLDRAASWLRHARRVVALTGAGISAESGIAPFRGEPRGGGASSGGLDGPGLWDAFPPEQFATPGGLARLVVEEPRRLAAFLRAVLEPVAKAAPNAGHAALAALERHRPVVVVTQNIDRLHQDAGSTVVHEVHGSLFDVVDQRRALLRRLQRDDLLRIVRALEEIEGKRFAVPRIARAISPLLGLGPLRAHRPNVVLFGEGMAEPAWSEALDAAADADVMLVVGTSGLVHPAASLPDLARQSGARVIGVGPEPGDADLWLPGRAGDVLPALVERTAAG